MNCRTLFVLLALASPLTNAQSQRVTKIASVRQLGPIGYRDPIGALSPDGKWLASVADTHLSIRPTEGGDSIALGTAETLKVQLAWLADGAHLAVLEVVPDSGVQWAVYSVADRTRTPLWAGRPTLIGHVADSQAGSDSEALPVRRLRDLAWSPDGRSVVGVVAGPHPQLWIVDVDGRNARVTTVDHLIGSPTWLPDSRRIACIMQTDAGPRVSLPCGDAPTSTWTQAVYGPLAFSPDGSVLYYASPNARGTLELWRRSLKDGSARQLTDFPRDTYAPTVARDGRVVFKTQTYATTIGVVASTGGPTRAVTSFLSETPTWNWTSTQLGVTYGNWRRVVDDERYPDISQDLGIVDLAGPLPATKVTAVVQASPSEDQSMCWSPNGRWIIFHSHQQHSDDIWLEPADRSLPPRQISAGGNETGWPRCSRDGRWIAFETTKSGPGGMRNRLFVIPINQETGETQPAQEVALDGAMGELEDAVWMPDGVHLALSTADPATNARALYVVSREGGPVSRVHEFESEQRYSGIGVSPDGGSVAFIAPAPNGVLQVFTVAVSGGAPRQITVDPIDKTQPARSPDGKQIAFARWEYRVDFLMLAPEQRER